MLLPRESQIVEYMQPGKRYTPSTIAFAFDVKLPQLQGLLRSMQDREVIMCKRPRTGERQYYLPEPSAAVENEAPARFVPTWKPLEASEEKRAQFQAGCESIRRNV